MAGTLRYFGSRSAGYGLEYDVFGDDSGPRFLIFGRWSRGGPWAVAKVPASRGFGDGWYTADAIGGRILDQLRAEFGASSWPFVPSREVTVGIEPVAVSPLLEVPA